MFVVLLLLVATVLQQIRHTGSSRLSGPPQSFSLNPKCSHNHFLWLATPHGALMLHSVMSGAGPRLLAQRQRGTDKRAHVRATRKTKKHAKLSRSF